jgi:hypothetical protein
MNILMLAASVADWMDAAKRLADANLDVTLTDRRDAALKVLAEDDVDIFLCHLDHGDALLSAA